MTPLEVLKRITAKIAPGRSPTFSEAHVLKALEFIGSATGVGRHRLTVELGVGEGTTRTLIKRFRDEGLIDVSRAGMKLSETGLELLSFFSGRLRGMAAPVTSITVGSQNYAVLVKKASGRVRRGVEQRDAAMLSGAEGATTLKYDGERLGMPGMERELDSKTSSFFLDWLKPEPDDVIIIGAADTLLSAEIGAKSAALKLLNDNA